MTTIEPHHNGPPGAGHGGVTAGRLAELVDPRRATVRLHAPVPVGVSLTPAQRPDGAWEVSASGSLIATVRATAGHLGTDLGPVADELVEQAEDRFFSTRDHPYPTCFVCGPARAAGTGGLGLRPGPVADGLHANWWVPAGAALGGESGAVPHWLVWAALDCPSGVAAMDLVTPEEAALTGELAVEISAPVLAGVRYQVLARARSREGRKIVSEAAVVDADGRQVATALATWISVPAPIRTGAPR